MKNKLTKEWLLENIYNLILDINTSQFEREVLISAKVALEQDKYYLQVARKLVSDLAPLAIQRKLSNKMVTFYTELQRRALLNYKIGPNSIVF